ncbi:hypothetical protein VTI74DRAFT_7469 [Chaetomium olivicolor]
MSNDGSVNNHDWQQLTDVNPAQELLPLATAVAPPRPCDRSLTTWQAATMLSASGKAVQLGKTLVSHGDVVDSGFSHPGGRCSVVSAFSKPGFLFLAQALTLALVTGHNVPPDRGPRTPPPFRLRDAPAKPGPEQAGHRLSSDGTIQHDVTWLLRAPRDLILRQCRPLPSAGWAGQLTPGSKICSLLRIVHGAAQPQSGGGF